MKIWIAVVVLIISIGFIIQKPRDSFRTLVAQDTARSGKWATLRKHFLETHPCCAYCGGTVKLQVHHIKPFHLNRDLELDADNLIVLCELPESDHHLRIGHLGNFQNENPNVVEDCRRHRCQK